LNALPTPLTEVEARGEAFPGGWPVIAGFPTEGRFACGKRLGECFAPTCDWRPNSPLTRRGNSAMLCMKAHPDIAATVESVGFIISCGCLKSYGEAQMKKTWVAPKLIILVRGKPEELVLDVCKAMFEGAGPTAMAFSFCGQIYLGACAACSDLSDS